MAKKHYIIFDCNKNKNACEASEKNFKTLSEIISEKLDDFYEQIVVRGKLLKDEAEPTEELMKIFNPVNYGYRVLKNVARSRNCEIDYIGLITDIDDFLKSHKEIYEDLTDDMVAFVRLQEKENENEKR